MSYSMTHLVIANQYIKRHGLTSSEAALFLLASISPDSVHKNPDFHKEMKERSHYMPEDIVWGNVYKEEQMDSWYETVREFYVSRYSEDLTAMELAFLQGYANHLLVDIFNCQCFYSPNLIQYGLDVKKFRKEYREQCLECDHFLYQNDNENEATFRNLKIGIELIEKNPILKHLNMENEVNCQDISEMVRVMEQEYKEGKHVIPKSGAMITVDKTESFIKEMKEQCDKLLFTFPKNECFFKVLQDNRELCSSKMEEEV